MRGVREEWWYWYGPVAAAREGNWVGGVLPRRLEEARAPRLCGNCSGRGRECVRSNKPHLLQRTFPGLKFERRQVDVSVVQQLKHRLRIPSVNLVLASEVCTTATGGGPGIGP